MTWLPVVVHLRLVSKRHIKEGNRKLILVTQEQSQYINVIKAKTEKTCQLCKEQEEHLGRITFYQQPNHSVEEKNRKTNHNLFHNKPVMTVVTKKQVWIIDSTVVGDRRVSEKEKAEKSKEIASKCG
ncbi:Kinesin-like protein KIF15-A, partial [Ophiophagus hannah]